MYWTKDVLMIENRNINIIVDADGNKLVLINDIVFKGKRNVNWDEVKTYLEQYIGYWGQKLLYSTLKSSYIL